MVIGVWFLLWLSHDASIVVTAKRIHGSVTTAVDEEMDYYRVTLPDGTKEMVAFHTERRRRRRAALLEEEESLLSIMEQDDDPYPRALLEDDALANRRNTYQVELPNGGNQHQVQFMITNGGIDRSRSRRRTLMEEEYDNDHHHQEISPKSLPEDEYKVILPDGQDQFVSYFYDDSSSSSSSSAQSVLASIEADLVAWSSEIFNMLWQEGDEGMNGRRLQRHRKLDDFMDQDPPQPHLGSYRLNDSEGNYYIVSYRILVQE